MAAQAALLLNTKSYAPRGKNSGDIATWALVGDASFGGATSLATEKVAGPNANNVYRVTFKVSVPKAATADSACACVGSILGTGLADVSLVIPVAFTPAERDDFRKRVQDLVANAVFTAATKDLEPSW